MATPDDVMRDKAQVRDHLYSDPARLGAREDLQRRFSVNPLPIADWELGLVDLSSVQRALDAGRGNGAFLLPLARRLAPQEATARRALVDGPRPNPLSLFPTACVQRSRDARASSLFRCDTTLRTRRAVPLW